MPAGWTLERVREVAQAEVAELLPLTRTVFVLVRDGTDYERVEPSVILHVGGCYLALAKGETDNWCMGQAEEDGPIVCWASYGPLGDALKAL